VKRENNNYNNNNSNTSISLYQNQLRRQDNQGTKKIMTEAYRAKNSASHLEIETEHGYYFPFL
jgi:hypothetical protein